MSPIDFALVTGGSGYYGEILVEKLLHHGIQTRIFDLNPPSFAHPLLVFAKGDIRDYRAILEATRGISHIFHNVAQVPLARDKSLFWSVNKGGTKNMIEAAKVSGVQTVIYTSSSAIFGIPDTNPVDEETTPVPNEDYGRAKLAGEKICIEAGSSSLSVAIIRPRTILGHGRLGIIQILFDWIERGLDIPVLDGGKNMYQFVHADDLATATLSAATRKGTSIYNIGAERFSNMRDTLSAVIEHAKTGSQLRSLPMRPIEYAIRWASKLDISPLGPYHAMMYGRSLYFNIDRAKTELGWHPLKSNKEMIIESYDWYVQNRDCIGKNVERSRHQSIAQQGVMAVIPYLLPLAPRA